MTFLSIYLLLAAAWGIFAVYKQHYLAKHLYEAWIFCLFCFIVNFLLFPICLIVAIKNKKI
jgi:hypothetical protein